MRHELFTVVTSPAPAVALESQAIESWYAERSHACRMQQDACGEAALGSFTAEYYGHLCRCLDANFDWLQAVLPEPMNERLQSEQGNWLAFRKSRFAALNLVHGLLGGGSKPFDRVALLLAHAQVVRERVLELEDFYREFKRRFRTPVLTVVR